MAKAQCNEMKHNEKILESTKPKSIVLPLNSASNIDYAKKGTTNETIQDEIKDDSKNSKRANEENTSKSNVNKNKKVKYATNESNVEDAKVNSGVEKVKPANSLIKLFQIQFARAELKKQQQASLDEDTKMPWNNIDSTIMENQSINNLTENQNGTHSMQERKKDLSNYSQKNMAEKKTELNSSKSKDNSDQFHEKCEFCEKTLQGTTKNNHCLMKRYHIYSCHFKTEI